MLADLGEPKAVKAWLLAFLYTLLMGGCRKMKPVSAAVQTALQIQLVTVGILSSEFAFALEHHPFDPSQMEDLT